MLKCAVASKIAVANCLYLMKRLFFCTEASPLPVSIQRYSNVNNNIIITTDIFCHIIYRLQCYSTCSFSEWMWYISIIFLSHRRRVVNNGKKSTKTLIALSTTSHSIHSFVVYIERLTLFCRCCEFVLPIFTIVTKNTKLKCKAILFAFCTKVRLPTSKHLEHETLFIIASKMSMYIKRYPDKSFSSAGKLISFTFFWEAVSTALFTTTSVWACYHFQQQYPRYHLYR